MLGIQYFGFVIWFMGSQTMTDAQQQALGAFAARLNDTDLEALYLLSYEPVSLTILLCLRAEEGSDNKLEPSILVA
ncbi:uncharacterized protein VTP21DRAFT_6494 [Calcarisporiella thermophila]|uniref:uncharacterized protein n=1 Tax=Calcarisporiella thermophila TaxID=911321 RepID=UPI0037441BF9